jgi:hypothetical protein
MDPSFINKFNVEMLEEQFTRSFLFHHSVYDEDYEVIGMIKEAFGHTHRIAIKGIC